MRGITFAIAMGIAILLPMLVNYGVSIFSPAPAYQPMEFPPILPPSATPEEKAQRQEEFSERNKKRLEEVRRHQRHLFYVAVPVGIAAIIGGTFVSVPAIGPGLVFGGVFTLIEGYWFYWSELEVWIKFISLLVALVALVFTAYSRLAPKSK
jgi:hypothetical protein